MLAMLKCLWLAVFQILFSGHSNQYSTRVHRCDLYRLYVSGRTIMITIVNRPMIIKHPVTMLVPHQCQPQVWIKEEGEMIFVAELKLGLLIIRNSLSIYLLTV